MTDWLRLLNSRPVVTRAIKYALVVGAILIAINHGDALLHGDVGRARWLKMGLTIMVPYWVSALSSASAMRDQSRAARSP